jgi:tRNA(Ile)-lysidine synthase
VPAAEAARTTAKLNLLEHLKTFVEPGRHVAVAVSGGSDSMALLRLCGELARRQHCSVTALTVDHGLRPGSAAEARQVEAWAQSIGIPHETLRWTGLKPVTGIQAAARAARYDLMAIWCKLNKVDVLLTAHTLDDQAETVAMRRKRSESPRSVAGIWPDMQWHGIHVLRPLLGFRREELRRHLKSLGQHWIDDPSNENTAFERIRVRRKLGKSGGGPGLAAMAIEAQKSVVQTETDCSAWLQSYARQNELGYYRLDNQALGGVPVELGVEIIKRLIRPVGGPSNVTPREIHNLAEWLREGDVGQPRRTLAGFLFARRRKDTACVREWSRIAAESQLITAEGVATWDNRFTISAPPGSIICPAGRVKGLPRPPDLPFYVFAGLPAVTCPGEPAVLPQFPPNSGENTTIRCEVIKTPGIYEV